MSATRICLVVDRETRQAASCRRHLAALFEVMDGPHKGLRGCQQCLRDLLGCMVWDRTQTVDLHSVTDEGE